MMNMIMIAFLMVIIPGSVAAQIPDSSILSWIKSVSLSLHSARNDSLRIHQLFANKHLVCIGEATHGSSEIFTTRQKLAQYLIEYEGFTCIAIEAPLTEVGNINRYVLGSDSNLTMQSLGYWIYMTEEIKLFIQWLRQYNFRRASKVQFYGIDITIPLSAPTVVRSFIAQQQPETVMRVDSAYSWCSVKNGTMKDKMMPFTQLSKVHLSLLRKRKEEAKRICNVIKAICIEKNLYNNSEAQWVLRNAEVLEMCLTDFIQLRLPKHKGRKTQLRDSLMAENVRWIVQGNIHQYQLDKSTENRVIVFAHNGHTRYGLDEEGDSTMGAYCKRWFGEETLSIATGFYEGTFQAISEAAHSSGKPQEFQSLKARPSSLEWYYHKTIMQAPVLIPFSSMNKTVQQWLSKPQWLHDVGATMDTPPSKEMQFASVIPLKTFDVFLFIDTISASHLLASP